MTKAKSKSKEKKAKKDSDLPKKVAGVKVPKAVQSNSLLTMFNSQLGREILADALIAAAGAAAAALTRTRTAQQAGQAVAGAGANAASAGADALQTASGAVAGVITEAAKNFLPPSLIGGEEEDERARQGGDAEKPRYVNLASDHNSRKKSKAEKADKPAKR
jgi:hypothetical protein